MSLLGENGTSQATPTVNAGTNPQGATYTAETAGSGSAGAGSAGSSSGVGPTINFVDDATGAFAPDWYSKLPEDMKEHAEALKPFKSLEGLTRSYLMTKQKLGDKTVKYPTEESSAEDWGKAFDALGRPKSPEEYELAFDEKIPKEHIDRLDMTGFKKFAHEQGLTKKQVSELTKWYSSTELKAAESIEGQTKAQKAEAYNKNVAAMRQEFGSDFDKVIERADRTAKHLGIMDELLKAGLGGNPAIIKALSKMGHNLSGEDKMSGASGMGRTHDIEARMAEIQGDPSYRNPKNPDHSKLVEEYHYLARERAEMRASRAGK